MNPINFSGLYIFRDSGYITSSIKEEKEAARELLGEGRIKPIQDSVVRYYAENPTKEKGSSRLVICIKDEWNKKFEGSIVNKYGTTFASFTNRLQQFIPKTDHLKELEIIQLSSLLQIKPENLVTKMIKTLDLKSNMDFHNLLLALVNPSVK